MFLLVLPQYDFVSEILRNYAILLSPTGDKTIRSLHLKLLLKLGESLGCAEPS